MNEPLCLGCGGKELRLVAKGRCAPCYRYWRRTGRERADYLTRRAQARAEQFAKDAEVRYLLQMASFQP